MLKLKMIIMEVKIRCYGSLYEYYKRKTLRQLYYANKLAEYTTKVNVIETDYKTLIEQKEEP